MLNAERFKEEINKYNNEFGLADSIADCKTLECRNCRFSRLNNSDDEIILCSTRKTKWLLSEYKEPVKLTKFERDILEYALKNTDYRFITRDDEDKLYFYSVKPRKYNRYWQYLAQKQRRVLSDDLFRFIRWSDEEPTSIKEVLENCEVVENAEEL